MQFLIVLLFVNQETSFEYVCNLWAVFTVIKELFEEQIDPNALSFAHLVILLVEVQHF